MYNDWLSVSSAFQYHLKSSCSAHKAHAQLCAEELYHGMSSIICIVIILISIISTVIILISIIMRSHGPVLPQPVNLSQSIETVLHTKGNPAHCTKQWRQKKLAR